MADLTVETLKWLVEHAAPNQERIDGIAYFDKALHPVFGPLASALTAHTLTGFVKYAKESIDDLPDTMIHVVSEQQVLLYAALEATSRRRECFAEALLVPVDFQYGRYFCVEEFLVALQSRFIGTEDQTKILQTLGTITEEHIRTSADDGVTQKVTVKDGIAFVKEQNLPNPVILKPFRTFLEIEQPHSEFILRGRKGHGGPEFALFEADGGAWKLTAIKAIAAYLKLNLSNAVIIA